MFNLLNKSGVILTYRRTSSPQIHFGFNGQSKIPNYKVKVSNVSNLNEFNIRTPPIAAYVCRMGCYIVKGRHYHVDLIITRAIVYLRYLEYFDRNYIFNFLSFLSIKLEYLEEIKEIMVPNQTGL